MARRLLDQGRHPGYISTERARQYAVQGGLFFAVVDGEDVAVAIVRPKVSSLVALNVHPDHRSRGIGAQLLAYLAPNWARVLQSAVPWFERHGFQPVGAPKQGRRNLTQVMVRRDLIGLAGRLDRLKLRQDACEPAQALPPSPRK